MRKSPRRQTTTSSPGMDGSAPTSSAASSKPSQGNSASATANIATDLPAAPTATGATTRSSSKPSQGSNTSAANVSSDLPAAPTATGAITRGSSAAFARQENLIAALQKRIAMLESSLCDIREHQSRGEASNLDTSNNNIAAEVPLSQTSRTTVQLGTVQLTEQHSPAIVNCTVPLSQPTDSRYTPPNFGIGTAATNHMYSTTHLGMDTPSIQSNSTTMPTFANISSTTAQSSSLPRKLQDLPDFSGQPEDWSIFYTAFIESTAIYRYSNYENNQRLLKSLKGYAREAVKSLLIHPNNVGNIIELLKFRFGRPEQLIRSQLAHVKEIAPISENAMSKIIPFATNSTAIYRYSNYENNQRLLKSLKGYAREAVKSLLIHPNNVGNIIELLKFRFGRPEQLIRSQLAHVKEIAPISENAMSKIIPFATNVCNICVFLQSAHGGELHLSNPTLLDELVSKLPMSKRVEWASFAALIQPYATVKHFSEWLSKLANIICTVCVDSSSKEWKYRPVLHTVQQQRSVRCPICQGHHKPAECARFLEYSVPNRWIEAKRHRLCFACLNLGHNTRNCQRRKLCSIEGCRRVHHKLLHEAVGNTTNSSSQSTTPFSPAYTEANRRPTSTQHTLDSQPPSKDAGPAVLSCSSTDSKLLFRILPVTLYGNQRRVDTYALLDEGSSITMIDSALVRDLGMRGCEQHLNVQWFGGHAAQESTFVVDLLISGAGMQKQHKLRNVYAVSNLQLPLQSLSKDDLDHNFKHISRLPVQSYTQVRPRLLIGLDHCHLGLPSTTMKVNPHGPFIANTELGWVVFGPTSTTLPSTASCLFMNRQADQSLHNMVADFFKTENFGVRAAPPIESEVDIRARAILKSATCRVDGRFETGLIWRTDNVRLPDSYNMALKRLVSVEQRMRRDAIFATQYKNIMNAYVRKKYARKLSPAEAAISTPKTWYLPHFAVANPNKPGKLRMVFDAAAEVSGISLNSQLLKGPQEYRPLPSILFHFREGAIAVCGDIKEMFHQVRIRKDDRCAQRFLWRGGDVSQPPDVYEMCVMTFGAACSPCAADYVKKVNALEHQDDRRTTARAVKAILDHHYVDDFVDSFCSEEEAISISQEVRAIHMDAGFELRNFISNASKVVDALNGTDVSRPIDNKEGFVGERVLGLFWQSSSDCFGFKFHNVGEAVDF
ncbi:uncharacterized protein [Bactrocera oleae]|uniref:uncharacterized protein n=1 Tax=Bactrocera oleae TaxID=104688 RepID=UPI00387E6F32